MLVLWQVGLGAPWWRHLVSLRFIDFNKCNSSHCKDSCLPKAEQILATGRTSDLQDLSRSLLVTSWLWWTQPTAYCQSRIQCKIYRAQIYRDWMGLLAEGAWLCEHMNPNWYSWMIGQHCSWMIGQHCNRLQHYNSSLFFPRFHGSQYLPILSRNSRATNWIMNPLAKVWRGWPQKEHPAEQPLVRSLLALCPVGCCTPFCWGYGNWRGCCC